MKHLHFNNYAPAKQDPKKFGLELFQTILETGDGIITMSVDDGDGTIWKYTISFEVEHMKSITQIKEN